MNKIYTEKLEVKKIWHFYYNPALSKMANPFPPVSPVKVRISRHHSTGAAFRI
jgi:hypothetical protein